MSTWVHFNGTAMFYREAFCVAHGSMNLEESTGRMTQKKKGRRVRRNKSNLRLLMLASLRTQVLKNEKTILTFLSGEEGV